MVKKKKDLESLRGELHSLGGSAATAALEEIAKMPPGEATMVMVDFLAKAPVGPLATRAAMAIEVHSYAPSALELLQIYENRPELAELIVPIFSELNDASAVSIVVGQLRELLEGDGRMSALIYLIKCAPHGPLIELLLPIVVTTSDPEILRDLKWALNQALEFANVDTIKELAGIARSIGPDAEKLVAPYIPAESELERQAPSVSTALLDELEKRELIELIDDEETKGALIEVLAGVILDARSPKGLIRDVERLLLNHGAVEELYGDRDDIRKAFESMTKKMG